MKNIVKATLVVGLMACGVATAQAQTLVQLPDQTQTTTFTVNVSEQARVQVPANVTFTVTNVANPTTAPNASVTIDQIVLATATKQLMVSMRANAPAFTPPAVGAATWTAGAVSWGAAAWTNATGVTGVLNSATFQQIATCTAGVANCSTNSLSFTLAGNPAVQLSGNHTLVVTWRFESIGT